MQDEVKYEYYDIAVANILADVIIMLQKEIPVHIKKNGIFITSGIIDMKEEAVKAAFEANDAFEIVEITHQASGFLSQRGRNNHVPFFCGTAPDRGGRNPD